MNLKKQLSNWYHDGDLDDTRFRYDALNGNINVLNSKQIIQKAQNVKKQTNIQPKVKRRMTRLIHQAQKNPYMHRIANVWNYKPTDNFEKNPLKTGKTILNYTDTAKAQSGNSSVGGSLTDAEDESPYVALARKGKVISNFAKKWNKLNPKEQIINAKQAGIKSTDERVREYPQVNNSLFKDDIKNSNLHNINFNGLRVTLHYIQGNHMNTPQNLKLLNGLKKNFHQIDNEQEYNVINKRMKQAKRTTGTIKRHRIKGIKDEIKLDQDTTMGDNRWEIPSLKKRLTRTKNINRKKLIPQAYAEDFGTGNDRIGGDVTPLKSGFSKYRKEKQILHQMNMKAPINSKVANKYSRKQIKHLKQEAKEHPIENKHYQAEIKSYKDSIKQNKLNPKTSVKRINIKQQAIKDWRESFPEIKKRNKIFNKQYKQARQDERAKDGYAHNLVYAHQLNNKQFSYFKKMKPVRLAEDYAHIDRINSNNPKLHISQEKGVEEKLHLHYMHKNLPKMLVHGQLNRQQKRTFYTFLTTNQRVSKQLQDHKLELQNEHQQKRYKQQMKSHQKSVSKSFNTGNLHFDSKDSLLQRLTGELPSDTKTKHNKRNIRNFVHSLHGRVNKHQLKQQHEKRNINLHRNGPQI